MEKVLEARRTALRAHLKKYGSTEGINKRLRHLNYCRFANDIVFGVVGPKEFAVKLRNTIDSFLKSSLHLEVTKNEIVGRNSHVVRFLGFYIELSRFRNKVRSRKAAHLSVQQYKKRVLHRLDNLDKKLANAAAYAARSVLLRTFRLQLEDKKKS